jgi:threonine synthase
MSTVCQRCGARGTGPSGVCQACGGVVLYEHPWFLERPGEAPPSPLVESRTPGLEGVLLKIEGAHASGSFKDRVMRVLVGEALDSGATGAVVASSGNAAIAAATACARARLPLLVLVPDAVSSNAVKMIQLRGGVVVRAGEGPAAVHGLAKRLSADFGLVNLASTFGAAGCEWACRGIGHEIAQQMESEPATRIAASISVGPVLIGAANGLAEAAAAAPVLVGAQASGCAPIAKAFECGDDEVTPWMGPAQTSALAIADRLTGYAEEATFALQKVRESGGLIGAVSDDEMQETRMALARHDGLDIELAACAAPAVLRAQPARPGTVCILTGNGVKETLTGSSIDVPESALENLAFESGAGERLLMEVDAWVRASR